MGIQPSFRLKRRKGFTLTEVLAAILVAGIFFTGIQGLLGVGYRLVADANDYQTALFLAQNRIELLRLGDTDTITTGTTSYDYSSSLREGAGTLQVAYDADSNIKKISMTVQWESIEGDTRNVVLSTLIVRGGLNRDAR